MEVTHLRFWSSIQTMWRTEKSVAVSNPQPEKHGCSIYALQPKESLGLPFRTHWRPQPSILIGPFNRSQQSLPWCTIQEGHYYRGGNAKAGTAGATTYLFPRRPELGLGVPVWGAQGFRRKSRGTEACRELVALDMR